MSEKKIFHKVRILTDGRIPFIDKKGPILSYFPLEEDILKQLKRMGYLIEDYGIYDALEEAESIKITKEVIMENDKLSNEVKSKEVKKEASGSFNVSDNFGRTMSSNEPKEKKVETPSEEPIVEESKEEEIVMKKIVEEPEEFSSDEEDEEVEDEVTGKKEKKKKKR